MKSKNIVIYKWYFLKAYFEIKSIGILMEKMLPHPCKGLFYDKCCHTRVKAYFGI